MSLEELIERWKHELVEVDNLNNPIARWIEKVLEKEDYSIFYASKKWTYRGNVGAILGISYTYIHLFQSGILNTQHLPYLLPVLAIPIVLFLGGAWYNRKLTEIAKEFSKELFQKYRGYLKVFLYYFSKYKRFRDLFFNEEEKFIDAFSEIIGEPKNENIERFVGMVKYVMEIEKYIIIRSKKIKLLEYFKKSLALMIAGMLYIPKKISKYLGKTIRGSFGKMREYFLNVYRVEEMLEAVGDLWEDNSPGGLYIVSKALGNVIDQVIPGTLFLYAYFSTNHPFFAFLAVISYVLGFFSTVITTLPQIIVRPIFALKPNRKMAKILNGLTKFYHSIDKNILLLLNYMIEKNKIRNPSIISSVNNIMRWIRENTDYEKDYYNFMGKSLEERLKGFYIQHYLHLALSSKKETNLTRKLKEDFWRLYKKVYLILSKLTFSTQSI